MKNIYVILLIVAGLFIAFKFTGSSQSLVTSSTPCTADYSPTVSNYCDGSDLMQGRTYCSNDFVVESKEKIMTCANGCANGDCVAGNSSTCQTFNNMVTTRHLTRTELGAAITSYVGG